MPTFKTKTNKKINVCKKYLTTLDGKHTEFVNEFISDENHTIPNLKIEKKNCKHKLDNEDLNIEEKLELLDRIREITKNIKELKKKKNNYYLDNSKYIFEYFENKKNIENNDENISTPITSKSQLLLNIFKIKPKELIDNNMTNSINEINTFNLVKKYLSNIDESFIDMSLYLKDMDTCSYCNIGIMTPLEDEGVLICDNCARHIPYLIENEKPNYKEPPKEVCFYSYKKITHFKEIISQFQAKETTQIPNEHIELIEQQIKKERITLDDLNYIKMKEILKKLELNKYYEHIAFIKNKLGIPPPVFSQELEETLCNLFMEILVPYAQVCPHTRVNFLNYHFVLYKLLELLDEKQYLPNIQMLKDDEKIVEQDDIWTKICNIKGWKAIPTVCGSSVYERFNINYKDLIQSKLFYY